MINIMFVMLYSRLGIGARAWFVVATICALPLVVSWWLTTKMAFGFYASGDSAMFSSFGALFLMWAIMMAAMMLPSVLPATALFARMQRDLLKTVCFVGAYLSVWVFFSLAVAVLQWQLAQWNGLNENLALSSAFAQGILLLLAGAYQFSTVKKACLRWCAAPVTFFLLHWHSGRLGAAVMGLKNGGFCVGCCWLLMLLLFVGGVMELSWILLLAVFALAEKVLPLKLSEITAKVIGGILLFTGIWLIF